MHKLAVAVILLGGAGVASAATPTLELGTPVVSGALDAKTVGAVVSASSAKLLACFKTALAKSPDLEGPQTSAAFTIESDGKVTAATATGLNAEAEKCVAAVIAKLVFASAKDRAPVAVTYPMVFDSGSPAAFATLTGGDSIILEDGLTGPETGPTVGFGYGTAGLGPGSGTIGTGRIGTIGGTGSGYGGGGMRRLSDVPTVSIGQPQTKGDLDKAIIRRYIKRNIQKLQYCYEKQLLVKAKLQGTVSASFTIGLDGKVSTSTATGIKDKDVETCVANVIRAIEFPKPKGATEVTVVYPFTFRGPKKK